MLLRAALKWGASDPDEADKLLPLTETLGFEHSEIRLFQYNGQWGYCLSLNLKKSSTSYSAFLKFCDPHETRYSALEAAVAKIEQEIGRLTDSSDHSDIKIWAKGLIAPQQLKLSLINLSEPS